MFEHYSVDYISQRLSLRTPQDDSLKILDEVLSKVDITNGDTSIEYALSTVNSMYPTCSDFGRDFMSLAFVLATGVGKTRLMGAFIAYLYTIKELRNFFVVAPNTVIYEKLRSDLGDPSSEKYVFKGLDCFAVNPPHIITGEDYRNKQLNISGLYGDVNIYVYNISKFDKDQTKMRSVNEWLGESFVDALAGVKDLVLLMDESHHYHADKGAQALNDLKPILGLELTATPYYNEKSKQKKFTNAVYEYPLSQSIRDGYTRTPYALTRSDFKTYGFDEDVQDQVILRDALVSHRRTKILLENYSQNTGKRLVKPFVLVVCKDTSHADEVYKYICSESFFNGEYANKTIVIHSGQKSTETDQNVALLQGVESADNPIEIVIHVNKLKEGWDVNNLYTIVPLRTAASRILREQMVGRGLRLPYGERTGIKDLDMVVLTAHDNFNELLKEAQSSESIFNKEKVLYAEQIEPVVVEKQVVNQYEIYFENDSMHIGEIDLDEEEQRAILDAINAAVSQGYKPDNASSSPIEDAEKQGFDALIKKSEGNKDRQEAYDKNLGPIFEWMHKKVDEIKQQTQAKFIPIPRIRIIDSGVADYVFKDFDLDLSAFHHQPTEQTLTFANLQNQMDSFVIKNQGLSLNNNPRSQIVSKLRQKPEIDYQKEAELIQKLVSQLLAYLDYKHGQDGMENIVFMNNNDLAERIYNQMMQKDHVEKRVGLFTEEVCGYLHTNYSSTLSGTQTCDLFYSPPTASDVPRYIFNNIKKGVFNAAKFDSLPELVFARVIERDPTVVNWLRPSIEQFEIYYEGGHRYEPDFVVETADKIYLVEVKGENQFNDPSVILKAQRGVQYCAAATRYAHANKEKSWEYLFLPSKLIHADSSFPMLVNQNYVSEITKASS